MINVDFYYFEKKMNSTKQPDASATKSTLSCSLKAGCGIFAPTLQIRSLGSGDPTVYNYCHIDKFDRYYFIDEWTYFEGVWECNLSEDVLATNKVKIGASTCYITRCSDSDYYNGTIIDHKYPCKGFTTSDFTQSTASIWDSTGFLVIGVKGQGGTGVAPAGGTTYYMLTNTIAHQFVNWLYADDGFIETAASTGTATTFTKEWVKYNLDPLSYITYAMWIPLDYDSTAGTAANIKIGWWDTGISARRIDLGTIVGASVSIARTSHPQASTRGTYLNMEPYSRYTYLGGPFGSIPLDSTVFGDASTLYIEVACDVTTGVAEMLLGTRQTEYHVLANLGIYTAQVGVEVSLTQTTTNVSGAAASVVGSAVKTVGNLLAGNIAGAAASVVNGGYSTAMALLPETRSIGANGTRIPYEISPSTGLWCRFIRVVDENIDHLGRPCCSEQEISDLSGYIEVLDGDIEIGGLSEEYDKVKSYLESGFFYE